MKSIGCFVASHNRELLHPPEANYRCNCLDIFNCLLDKRCFTPNKSLTTSIVKKESILRGS